MKNGGQGQQYPVQAARDDLPSHDAICIRQSVVKIAAQEACLHGSKALASKTLVLRG